MFKENKKAVSLDFYLQPSIYIYMCTSYTARCICILSLQYIWISSGLSRCLVPTPGLTSEYPTCSVCVCAYTHTTHTHQPPVKNGETLPSPNESLTLETNANCRPAGKTPLTPLLHTHAIVFETPVNSTKYTYWAYICKEKMTTTKWIKMMTETTSTTTTGRRKLVFNIEM